MAKVTPFIWFTSGASDALALYEKVFTDCEVLGIERNPDGSPAKFMAATLRIGDAEIVIFDGGPFDNFAFNEAFSLSVDCVDQAEVDRLWEGLTANGGTPGQCGWLKDPFGLSWQIVPRRFRELTSSSDGAVRDRVFAAMMKMTKFVIADLEAAAASS